MPKTRYVVSAPGVYARTSHGDVDPVVFDIPRSGRELPGWFASPSTVAGIRNSASLYVEELYSKVVEGGATWLYACFPNAVIDPNRNDADIDPAQIEGQWPTTLLPSEKAQAGSGLIPRKIGDIELNPATLPVAEVQRRLNELYLPYHAELGRLLDTAHKKIGVAYHLSCHSMKAMHPASKGTLAHRRTDFDLGDRRGTTCNPELVELVSEHLKALGYTVSVNRYFAGAEAIRRHSSPDRGKHSLQIEIVRDLYMDEKSLEIRRVEASRIADEMAGLARKIVTYAQDRSTK
ncbi:N-formylglutamate amidohydrolase [Caballeronia sp. dw_19]|uniref:N-formylglutamate amidohydrolase n=1 Tax=Caballeronia sp. dw_19 TaxID=2719791 RepID=UPI001BCE6D4C|nr:N-formylglutamate amidohydrolase [Caballeronia sp. dw_19]